MDLRAPHLNYRIRGWKLWLAAAAGYFLLAAGSIALTTNGASVSPIWPANALLVAMLVAHRRKPWATILSAGFIANAAAGCLVRGTLVAPLLYGMSNMAEVAIAATLMKGIFRQHGALSSSANVFRFIAVAGVIAPSISAFAGAATAWAYFGQPLGRAFWTWLLGDALGLMLFTPIFLAILVGDLVGGIRRSSWRVRLEGLALLGLTAVVAIVAFFIAQRPLLFVIYAPIMLATFRMGPVGAKVALMLVAVIGAIATVHGHGPITVLATPQAEQVRLLQIFLAVLLATCLPVVAEVSARTRLTEELARRERAMAKRATTDSLTGLLNRDGFEQAVEPLWASAPRSCLVAIDLDHFKGVNDGWGHQVGDRALIHLAMVLRSQVRMHDLVGRVGGDELMLYLPNSDVQEAHAICGRLQAALRRAPLPVGDNVEILISVSCGVALAKPGDSYEDAARRADEALYRAKDAGRNAIRRAQA